MSPTAATAIRDLRTGHSPWHGVAVPAKALRTSPQVDVLIVGAGMSGALPAHSLAGRHPRVAAVDRRSWDATQGLAELVRAGHIDLPVGIIVGVGDRERFALRVGHVGKRAGANLPAR
jgi:choline dehydrogenase-like flavoprotein